MALQSAAKRVVVEKAKITSRSLLQLGNFHGIDLSVIGQSRTETGSAFCWDASGEYLTAEHVIGAARSIALETGFPLSVQKRWVTSDVALLNGPPCQPVERRKSPLSKGEAVLLTGFSPSKGWQTQLGEVVEAEKPRSIGYGWSPPLFAVKAMVGPGFSGGMALDDQGRLVGMIQAAEVGSMAYVMTTSRLVAVINQTPVHVGISLSSGQFVDIGAATKTRFDLPIGLIALHRFGMAWTDPRPVFEGLALGDALSVSTTKGQFELTAVQKSDHSLSLTVVSNGWLVIHPGAKLGEMGLLPNDIIVMLSGAAADGEPPKTLRGMLTVRRGQMTYTLWAP